jgi:co-chaperonin GroES (HSP10)
LKEKSSMSSDSYNAGFAPQTLAQAFPEVDHPVEPFGSRVVVQLRLMPSKSKSGIVLIENTKDTAKWNNQIAKLVAVGSLAFKHRETGEAWPEGVWAKVGDFVRVPRWDGDRMEVKHSAEKDADPVIFVTFKDSQLIGRVRGDPLTQLVYEL